LLSLFLSLFLLSFTAFAQSDRGTITGTIADPAGAVVANAAVEAKNTATSAIYQAASSGTGNYTIAQLPAGAYEMTVNVPGFKKYVRGGLQVEVAGTVRIDVTLEVGSATESVTVEAAAPLLKTEGGEVSTNIATNTLDDLPILTRLALLKAYPAKEAVRRRSVVQRMILDYSKRVWFAAASAMQGRVPLPHRHLV